MPNTFAIYNDIEAAEQLLATTYDTETGEITGDYEAAEALRAEVQALGLETLCKARANRLALIANIKAEEERLKARRQSIERTVERLENDIYAVYQHGDNPVQYAGNFTVSTRKSTQVITDDDFADSRFITTKTTESVDKVELKKALAAGEQIMGARLQTNYNLQIK
jgi:hypothetical protein